MKFKPMLPHIGFNQLSPARVKDGISPRFNAASSPSPVDAGHLVTKIGEVGAGHEADVAGSDHCNAHCWRAQARTQ
jgi:hypothetical protein